MRERQQTGREQVEGKPKKPRGPTPEQKAYRVRFGAWLKAERERRGMTQRGLADAAGVHYSRINRIEAGVTGAEVETVRSIARALEVPDMFALVEAGFVQAVGRDAAEVAVLFEGLTGERRRLARVMLQVLAVEEGRRTE